MTIFGGTVQGKSVCLRPLRHGDSDQLYKWINDREMVILSKPFRPISKMEHESWMESVLSPREDLCFFVIQSLDFDKAIGTCKLLNIDLVHRNAELQIKMGETQSLGKGLGTEAVRLLTAYAFKELGLHRIYLQVFETNTRAIRSYEKCGFKREGLLRDAVQIDGKYLGIVSMGLLESEHE